LLIVNSRYRSIIDEGIEGHPSTPGLVVRGPMSSGAMSARWKP
jgi:hypothetical protein